jgi:UDP-MurNAc hydroxylase
MKITFYQSSNVLIEDQFTKIFCDPWIEDGEHLGSWNHYPPLEFDYSIFDDVDYIYISHIHEDHTSHKTLKKIPKHIPILLYNFEEKFLKKSVQDDGN